MAAFRSSVMSSLIATVEGDPPCGGAAISAKVAAGWVGLAGWIRFSATGQKDTIGGWAALVSKSTGCARSIVVTLGRRVATVQRHTARSGAAFASQSKTCADWKVRTLGIIDRLECKGLVGRRRGGLVGRRRGRDLGGLVGRRRGRNRGGIDRRGRSWSRGACGVATVKDLSSQCGTAVSLQTFCIAGGCAFTRTC
jgi:hypothetical protein